VQTKKSVIPKISQPAINTCLHQTTDRPEFIVRGITPGLVGLAQRENHARPKFGEHPASLLFRPWRSRVWIGDKKGVFRAILQPMAQILAQPSLDRSEPGLLGKLPNPSSKSWRSQVTTGTNTGLLGKLPNPSSKSWRSEVWIGANQGC